MKNTRKTHLVGTIPAESPRGAMQWALSQLGDSLDMVPDGETHRPDWVLHIVEELRTHPDFELTRDGDWSDYSKTPMFRVRRGHTLRGDDIKLGIEASFRDSYPIYRELAVAHGRSELPFQVGAPGDLDVAMFALGPARALRHRRAFTDATLGEIRAIHAEAGDQVVFQIEVPAELVFVASVPRFIQPAVAGYLARGIAGLARQAPEGARFGIHLCVGDLQHRALARMRDSGPLVRLANAIAAKWPAGRPLEFVHAPFSAAVEPPPVNPRWYRPLAGLRLPTTTRFIAGCAHERQDLAAQVHVRNLIERMVGRQVDIATSCGLGRRDPAAADSAMRRTAELASSPAATVRESDG
ncbi:hypothetical protein [Micromonospora sp. MH33]|uniref:hypothetical protein n=1 Tax=Micromonospora sp. MH33 TaxID=1945509 RepID=UPI0011B25B34|nr:hypothetical protein [Micromonospora sp. MH33]